MGKLIKPKNMDAILANGIVLHSRKQYDNLQDISYYIDIGLSVPRNSLCAVRNKRNIYCTAATRIPCKYKYGFMAFDCTDIDYCDKCFLNARNYLNVLKYIKKGGNNATTVVKI